MSNTKVQKICVFCGANAGENPQFRLAAEKLGRLFAEHKITLVYGGSNRGIMKIIADHTLQHGGHVIGVMPRVLSHKEVLHTGLSEVYMVDSMHERKALMNEKADAFIALPGGFGTLDELFEVITWAQIGIHNKPIAILNVENYFGLLLQMMDHMVESGLAPRPVRETILVDHEIESLLQKVMTRP